MKFIKVDWSKKWKFIKIIPIKVKNSFLVQDGEKQRVNIWLILFLSVPVVLSGILISFLWENKDNSYLNQSSEQIVSKIDQKKISIINRTSSNASIRIAEGNETRNQNLNSGFRKIKYSARQVIDRFGGMPAGTNFIGKLLTSIDTRDPGQTVKVILPYGATYQKNKTIENGSTLLGIAHYGGNGDRVFLRFNRLINADGTESPIQAQGLNSKDFAPGLSGELYTNTDARLMATVGLGMISAGADVLVQKESLGHSYEPTPKSSLRNAAMAGLGKGAQMEVERRISGSESVEEYVVVESGAELIVSLTEAYKSDVSER